MKRRAKDNRWDSNRQANAEKTKLLKRMTRLFAGSTLTEQDAVTIGCHIKRRVWQKHYAQTS